MSTFTNTLATSWTTFTRTPIARIMQMLLICDLGAFGVFFLVPGFHFAVWRDTFVLLLTALLFYETHEHHPRYRPLVVPLFTILAALTLLNSLFVFPTISSLLLSAFLVITFSIGVRNLLRRMKAIHFTWRDVWNWFVPRP